MIHHNPKAAINNFHEWKTEIDNKHHLTLSKQEKESISLCHGQLQLHWILQLTLEQYH